MDPLGQSWAVSESQNTELPHDLSSTQTGNWYSNTLTRLSLQEHSSQ